MRIEDQIFVNLKPDFTKLVPFGFEKKGPLFVFSQAMPQTDFRVAVTIDRTGKVTGQVIDQNYQEEYVNFRAAGDLGSFAANVKDQYCRILKHIADNCFIFDPTVTGQDWLIPANPKYFDLAAAFAKNPTIIWKQSTHIKVGDAVYIYVAAPVSALVYKCLVLATDQPYDYRDKNVKMQAVMQIRLLQEYDPTAYTFAKLKTYGVKAIRGPRHLPQALADDLDNQKD